ncbi:MAG: hypothetical protein AAGJ80_14385, partial [Cyanobacteria bacterium J06553_1]
REKERDRKQQPPWPTKKALKHNGQLERANAQEEVPNGVMFHWPDPSTQRSLFVNYSRTTRGLCLVIPLRLPNPVCRSLPCRIVWAAMLYVEQNPIIDGVNGI